MARNYITYYSNIFPSIYIHFNSLEVALRRECTHGRQHERMHLCSSVASTSTPGAGEVPVATFPDDEGTNTSVHYYIPRENDTQNNWLTSCKFCSTDFEVNLTATN